MRKVTVLSIIILSFCFCKQEPEKKLVSKNAKVEFRLAVDSLVQGFEEKELEGQKVYLNPKIELTEKEIAFVYKVPANGGIPTLNLDLTPEGAKTFEKVTAENIEKKLGVVVNGQLIFCPVIMGKIPGGKLQISLNIAEAELDSLYRSLTE
jgi:preprotein translocase subunit SecD